MSKTQPLMVPFVEAHYTGGKQKPTAIVINASFTNSNPGAALGVAQAWHARDSSKTSGHYTVDESHIFRCVDDKLVSGHGPFAEKGAIRIMVCAEPVSRTTFWDERTHELVLSKTAELVAELIRAHKIQAAYLDSRGRARWQKHPWRRRGGIIVDEPSGWPSQTFINEVRAHI